MEIKVTERQISVSLGRQDPNFSKNLEAIKACLDGRRYDSKTKTWHIKPSYGNLAQILKNFKFDQRNQDKVDEINKLFDRFFPPLPSMNFEKIDFPCKLQPMKHQAKMINFLLNYDGNWGLLWEMGTGKTAVLVHYIYKKFYAEYQHKNILIVCPNGVKDTWIDEMDKHSWVTDFRIFKGTARQRERIFQGKKKLIINYELLLSTHEKYFDSIEWDLVVADEMHRAASNSKTNKVINKIIRKSKRFIGLTGTPFDKEVGFFYIAEMINPMVFGNQQMIYQYRWFLKTNTQSVWVKGRNGGPARQIEKGDWIFNEELREEHTKRCRHLAVSLFARECIDLPPRTFVHRYAEMPPRVLSLYLSYLNEAIETLESAAKEKENKLLIKGATHKLRQLCSGFEYEDLAEGEMQKAGAKRKVVFQDEFRVKELYDTLLDIDGRAIIWYSFTHEGDMIHDYLTSKKVVHTYIDSTMSADERASRIDSFRKKGGHIVLSINMYAEGITVNETTHSIYYGYPNYASRPLKQSLARNYRKGQENHVTVTFLVCQGGLIDTYIINTIMEKIDDADSFGVSISMDAMIRELRGQQNKLKGVNQ